MNNEIQFLLYNLPDEEGRVQVVIKDETIWATQKAMAQLFGVGVTAISKHLAHIFEEGELDRNVAFSKMEILLSAKHCYSYPNSLKPKSWDVFVFVTSPPK